MKTSRVLEDDAIFKARRAMERTGYGVLCVHSNVFRAEGDRLAVTFNLCYEAISDIVVWG